MFMNFAGVTLIDMEQSGYPVITNVIHENPTVPGPPLSIRVNITTSETKGSPRSLFFHISSEPNNPNSHIQQTTSPYNKIFNKSLNPSGLMSLLSPSTCVHKSPNIIMVCSVGFGRAKPKYQQQPRRRDWLTRKKKHLA